ncbi:MAG: hypothetical protein LBB89_11190 [Treponema sp.]|jgi:hypothetical protein|nr:hypothetical protein [Treponema sp.]
MDTKELTGKEPYYFFPELLPYLRNDLLPGINELLGYVEQLRGDPNTLHGLATRIEALRDDLTNALAGIHAGETKVV